MAGDSSRFLGVGGVFWVFVLVVSEESIWGRGCRKLVISGVICR